MTDYHGWFTVQPIARSRRSMVIWGGSFNVVRGPEAAVEVMMRTYYDIGLGALRQRFNAIEIA